MPSACAQDWSGAKEDGGQADSAAEPLDRDGGAEDASLDAEPTAPPSDAATASEAGIIVREPDAAQQVSVAGAGAPCGSSDGPACAARNSTSKLLCVAGIWQVSGVCDGETRCDARAGSTQGTCQAVVPACIGHAPGDAICEGTIRYRCGDDRLDYLSYPCPTNSHCERADMATCECDRGYQRDGSGTCINRDDCSGVTCGGKGSCVDEVDSYHCECAPGYQASADGKSCVDADECAGELAPQRCGIYPCVDGVGSFMCLGQHAEWPMPDAVAGARTAPSLEVAADIVTDRVTGLVWQRSMTTPRPECSYSDGACLGITEAQKYCENLLLADATDWRLPTAIELISLRHDVAAAGIDTAAFPDPKEGVISLEYWRVSYDAGSENTRPGPPGPVGGYVRCVRGGTAMSDTRSRERYLVDANSGTVRDTRTRLLWQRGFSDSLVALDQAAAYCAALPLIGGGWRLPTRKELATLVTLGGADTDPKIDLAAFPSTPAAVFASASVVPDNTAQRYAVSFVSGGSSPQLGATMTRVRCVQ